MPQHRHNGDSIGWMNFLHTGQKLSCGSTNARQPRHCCGYRSASTEAKTLLILSLLAAFLSVPILVAKVYAVDADKNDMKQFFQGLVLGAALMYGYLYHSAGLLARLQNWFGYIAGQYREDRHSQEAEKALHGFLLRRDLRLMDEESTRG